MFRNREPDVLVVGAGPVGLAMALMLTEEELAVELIDERFGSSIAGLPNFALLLHPTTLAMLADSGIACDLIERGARIERVAIYDRSNLRATARLGDLGTPFPFALAVGHHDLVEALSAPLRAHKQRVRAGRRLSLVQQGDERAVATVDQLGVDSGGLVVDGPLYVVEKVIEEYPRFVLGTDGWHSRARRCANVSLRTTGPPTSYAILELASETVLDGEARVIIGERTVDSVWPLPDGRCRWTLQIAAEDIESLGADARSFDHWRDDVPRELVDRLLGERAPWFRAQAPDDEPALHVRVEPAFALCFGLGRIWLAGDAAHVANPIGVHSLNFGLLEAPMLARALAGAVRGTESAQELYGYDDARCAEWQGCFGPNASDGWVIDDGLWTPEMAGHIVGSLPATGQGLVDLAAQIGIHLPASRNS